jgi:hypothetical protein
MPLPEKRQVVLKKFKTARQGARRSQRSDRGLTGIDYRRTAGRFSKQRYQRVPGFLPKPVLQYLKVYFDVLLANDRFSVAAQCPSSLSLGGDPGLDAVLEWARPHVSRLVGFELAPTYSNGACASWQRPCPSALRRDERSLSLEESGCITGCMVGRV